jgi:steroid 5-alpha reductase family enzyme
MYSGWRSAGASLLAANVALWLWSLRLGKAWPVDFIWSSWPVALAVALAVDNYAPEAGLSLRVGVVCLLVAAWGFRLTFNFVQRGGIGHEDWRYTAMRADFGRHFWWISLFSVFLGQSGFMFAGSLALFPAIRAADEAPLSFWLFGVACTAAAIAWEAIADAQLDRFVRRAAARARGAAGTVCRSGLWSLCRHPNYLGELSFWLGLYVLGRGEWTVVRGASRLTPAALGPLLLFALFRFVSVGLMETRQATHADWRRRELYRVYQRDVPSALIPLLPLCGGGRSGAARARYGGGPMLDLHCGARRDSVEAHCHGGGGAAPPLLALEVQSPWGLRLVDGTKSIETRRYALRSDYVGREMHVLETPAGVPGVARTSGRNALTAEECAEHGMRTVGVVAFGESFRYASPQVSTLLFTVTFHANLAHSLTRSP